VSAWLEPGVVATPGATWQFERLGYFIADLKDSSPQAPVLNRIVTLRDTRPFAREKLTPHSTYAS
jgi:glutaminyl-tRNA synthetase